MKQAHYIPAMRDGTYPPDRASEFFAALASAGAQEDVT
jgi:hypothetical protein